MDIEKIVSFILTTTILIASVLLMAYPVNAASINITNNGTTIIVILPTDSYNYNASINFSNIYTINDTIINTGCVGYNDTIMIFKTEINNSLILYNQSGSCPESRFTEILNATRENDQKLAIESQNIKDYINNVVVPKQDRLSLLEGNLSDCTGKLADSNARLNNTLQGLQGKDQQIFSAEKENKSLMIASWISISLMIIFIAFMIGGRFLGYYAWKRN